jgi:hypothetical protein
VHFSRLIAAKRAEASLVATKLIPLHSYMPQFLDMARPPAYLMNRSTASDSALSTPTAVTTASAGKKFTPPSKKVNFGALNTQDSADQSPITSSSASTITAADDWAPYDDTAVREIVNDPSNEKLISQPRWSRLPPSASPIRLHAATDVPRMATGETRDSNRPSLHLIRPVIASLLMGLARETATVDTATTIRL